MERIEHYEDCLSQYANSRSLREQKYDRLIESASGIIERKRAHERLRPPKFNIFDAIGCSYKEDAHTSLLKYFLDPYGEHGQGIVFLKSFLELVQEAAHVQRKNLTIVFPEDSLGWVCRKEVALPGSIGIDGESAVGSLGRVDILIRTHEFIAVVENKILAADGDRQLARYWEFLQSVPNVPHTNKVLIYLTPDGRGPNDWSFRNDPLLTEHLVLLSYRTDLYEMFQKNANSLQAKESAVSVTEVLRQYSNLIRSFV